MESGMAFHRDGRCREMYAEGRRCVCAGLNTQARKTSVVDARLFVIGPRIREKRCVRERAGAWAGERL